MREQDEDAAWREIVANYGERASLESPSPETLPPPSAPQDSGTPAHDEPGQPEEAPKPEPAAERFHPPPPPPLPRPRGLRGLAWLGLAGAPILLLLSVLTGTGLPRMLSGTLAVIFLAGFGYLVWTMPRGPRDPGDDGARV